MPEFSGFFIIILLCSEKVYFLWKVRFYWYLACLSGIKVRIVNIWLQCNNFVLCADNILLLKLLFVPCVWNLLQIKYIFLRNSYFLKIKSFSFSCLLYYYLKGSMLLCFLLLYWVFIKSVFAVDSEVVAVCDILIFKNIAFCRNYLSCLFVMFCFGRVFDWEILDCFFWLFVLVVFCWTVAIWRGRRKIKVWRCIATLLLLNPVSKWVRSDSNG